MPNSPRALPTEQPAKTTVLSVLPSSLRVAQPPHLRYPPRAKPFLFKQTP